MERDGTMEDRRTFIKTLGIGSLLIGLPSFLSACNPGSKENLSIGDTFLRSTPELQGVSSQAISRFISAAYDSGLEFHSVMILKNSHVIAEAWWSPFAPALKHTLYSLSKSFTSTAVGMTVDDGLISVEDSVISFFPDDLPVEQSDYLKAMKIKDLLTMTTGHADKPMTKMQETTDGNWARVFLSEPIVHEPGSHFLYNTAASYMLSAIVQKVVGMTMHDFLKIRLFEPLRIEGSDWESDPNGINVGGYGLRLKTEDLAKLGQLYLQKGMWNNVQLISAEWVEEATKKQTESQEGDNDWAQGYGYQFWRCKPEPGFYRGDGAFGQYCIVIPQYGAVIIATSESKDMQQSMNLIWEHLLPALKGDEEIPDNESDTYELKTQISNLTIPVYHRNKHSDQFDKINANTYTFEPNKSNVESIKFGFSEDSYSVSLKSKEELLTFDCGIEEWKNSHAQMSINSSLFVLPNDKSLNSKVAATATWENDQTLIIDLKYIEGIHGDRWTCKFEGDKLKITFKNSVSMLQNSEDDRESWIGSVQH